MPSLPRIRSRRVAPGAPVVETRPGPAELRAGGVTWVHLLSPTSGEAQLLANRFGWHPLDVEDVLSRRNQTHGDWNHADMQVYRARLRALGGCPRAAG